jgi:hypothetical protein
MFARDWLLLLLLLLLLLRLLLRAKALLVDPDSRGLGVLEARKIRARGTWDKTVPLIISEMQRNCKDGCTLWFFVSHVTCQTSLT